MQTDYGPLFWTNSFLVPHTVYFSYSIMQIYQGGTFRGHQISLGFYGVMYGEQASHDLSLMWHSLKL